LKKTTPIIMAIKTRKNAAQDRCINRLGAARKDMPDLSGKTPEEAFLMGLKQGYEAGLIDGVRLREEAEIVRESLDATEVGRA